MSHSLNEIDALAKRAARGAGLSWGMAEEAAKATRWLASYDLAGPALLAGVLAQNDGLPQSQVAPVTLDGVWHAAAGTLCPLAAGASLNDCADRLGEGQPIEMANISCPLLILPFAAWAAFYIKQPVRVVWQDLRLDTDGDGIWTQDLHAQINTGKAATLICHPTIKSEDPAKRPAHRGTVEPDVWARLDAFAQRTFAPATDASRLLGAGAGRSDND